MIRPPCVSAKTLVRPGAHCLQAAAVEDVLLIPDTTKPEGEAAVVVVVELVQPAEVHALTVKEMEKYVYFGNWVME